MSWTLALLITQAAILVLLMWSSRRLGTTAYRAGWWAARAETLDSFVEGRERGLTDREWIAAVAEADRLRAIAEGLTADAAHAKWWRRAGREGQ